MTERCYDCKVELIENKKDHFKCPKCGETTWVIGRSLKEIRGGARLARLDAKHVNLKWRKS